MPKAANLSKYMAKNVLLCQETAQTGQYFANFDCRPVPLDLLDIAEGPSRQQASCQMRRAPLPTCPVAILKISVE